VETAPAGRRLAGDLEDPGRGFDAVVIGEPARAFYGNQFGLTFPVFVHYLLQLWVPEVGGQVDPGSDAHDLVMAMYGGMSKGERNRIKIWVRTAMQAQALLQGRYLGGRPPYGYRLVDAGPHPNPGKFACDWRAHPPVVLEVGPVLHPDDAVANKVTALFGRAAPRDHIDVHAALTSGRYTPERLLILAKEHDDGSTPPGSPEPCRPWTGGPTASTRYMAWSRIRSQRCGRIFGPGRTASAGSRARTTDPVLR
jgi:hypothetical protein